MNNQFCVYALFAGEGTIPTIDASVQTIDGIGRGDRLKTMSCSDKICKWNVLGVQGTLLADLMEPVYIDTLILGECSHAISLGTRHYSRAVHCQYIVQGLVSV